ncbi:MAG: choice-of-anchor D domain-containing protein [Rubrivivax sp.]
MRLVHLAAGLAWAVATLLPTTTALAQDVANGQMLYITSIVAGQRGCSNIACHGSLPANPQNRITTGISAAKIQAAVAGQSQMSFLAGRLTAQQYNDLAAYIASTLGGTPSYLPVAAAPRPTLSPTSLGFGNQPLAVATPLQTLTLSNAASATAALTITDFSTTAGSDFALSGGSCQKGQSLAAGASCTLGVVFRPTLSGTRSGTLTVTHNAGSSTATLVGTGGTTAPAITLSPSQLTFAETLGSTSPSQRVLVSNTGQAPLVFSALTIAGAQAADFALASSGNCAVGTPVAAGANCALDLRFTPSAAGTRNATLTLSHNAGSGTSTVALVGAVNASASPNLTLDHLLLDLGTQALNQTGSPRTLTLGNSGTANLVFSSLSVVGLHAADMVLGGSCSTSLAVPPQGQCTVTVALRPSALGTRSAQLVIASNAPSGSATVSLSGEAISTAAPFITLSQAALGFGRVTVGTSAVPRVAQLSNSGAATLLISGITSSGGGFSVSHDCPASLPAGQGCALTVGYTPQEGVAAEQMVIQSNAFSSPNSVVLTGQGVTTSLPVLAWRNAPASVDFGPVQTGQTGTAPTLTLENQGPGEVAVSALALVGADAGVFSVGGGTCLGGVRLAQGSSCTVVLSFAPDSAGPRSATLLVASNGSNPPDTLLRGTGATSTGGGDTGGGTGGGGDTGGGTGGGGGNTGGGSGTGSVTPFAADRASLDFRAIAVRTGGQSEALSLRISNRSAATATIRSLTASGGFTVTAGSATDACQGVPWTLSPGASCTVDVRFTPSTGGSATGQLRVEAQDLTVLSVPLQAEARTEVTNVGAGAGSPWWVLGLALAALALVRLQQRSQPLHPHLPGPNRHPE